MVNKKDAYYFKHDSNAKDDPKCVLLIETLQLEGYGIFWILIETLRDQPGYKYPLALLPAIARRYNTTIEKIKAVIYSFDLFEIDDNKFFYSDSLNHRMIAWDENKQKYIEAGKASGRARRRKAIEHKSNDVQTSLELLDKSIINESKEEEIILPAVNIAKDSIIKWNTKTNLPKCRFTILNIPSDILRDMITHLSVFKPEEINKAIDNLSDYYEKEDPKFRVNSFQSFAIKSIDRWIDDVKPWERYQDDSALPDCAPQESTIPKWIEEEGATFE